MGNGDFAEGKATALLRDARGRVPRSGGNVRKERGQGADRRCAVTADLSQCSDQELAILARAHREEACRELLRRYKAGVYRLIVKQIGDADEAMDLTQEAFVAGFSALDRYDGDRSFRTWIARIALNKSRDWARRRKVRAFFSRALPLERAQHVASDGPTPDSEAPDKRELAQVHGAIRSEETTS